MIDQKRKNMKIRHTSILALLTIVFANCSSEPEMQTALINGKITVADSVDSSKDYSGIQLLITHREDVDSEVDTLFLEQSNRLGNITGKVEFPFQGIYPVYISRNGNVIGSTQFILADNDTINFSGELPGLSENFEVDSRENRAMEVYNRVDKGFRRVLAYINAGAVADTLIEDELRKWSDLFWEVYENYPGTFASNMAGGESVRLLNTFDQNLMMKRINDALPSDEMIGVAAKYGFEYKAETQGVEGAVSYLDSLQGLTKNPKIKRALDQERIAFYFDSARVDIAKDLLAEFEKEYDDDPKAQQWAKTIGYDLSYLAPGYRVPEFSFETDEGEIIAPDSLVGKPYILEITPVASRLYQNQYDRTVVIHQIYQNYDLEVFTIPLDKSEVTVQAFFDERVKHWSVAKFGGFDVQKLIETFNVTQVPTRILIDQQGNIVRKYVAEDFTDVIQGLNTIIKQNQKGS